MPAAAKQPKTEAAPHLGCDFDADGIGCQHVVPTGTGCLPGGNHSRHHAGAGMATRTWMAVIKIEGMGGNGIGKSGISGAGSDVMAPDRGASAPAIFARPSGGDLGNRLDSSGERTAQSVDQSTACRLDGSFGDGGSRSFNCEIGNLLREHRLNPLPRWWHRQRMCPRCGQRRFRKQGRCLLDS